MNFFLKVLCLSVITLTPGFAASRLTLEKAELLPRIQALRQTCLLPEFFEASEGKAQRSLLSSVTTTKNLSVLSTSYVSTCHNRNNLGFLAKPSFLPPYRLPAIQRLPYSGGRAREDVDVNHSVIIVNPCIDSVFQYGFADPKILADFLNTILDFKGEGAIEEIEYLPRDMTSSDPLSFLVNHFTVDVRCRTKVNHHFVVEIQNDFRDDYHLKSLIEHSRMLSRLDTDQTIGDLTLRSEKNKNDIRKFWKGIQGLYTIVLTNKSFPNGKMKKNYPEESVMEPFLVNSYELRHTEQLDRRYGDVPNQLVLLMLDNLKGTPDENSSAVERWAYLFKDPSLRSGVKKISETKKIEDPEIISGGNKAIEAFIERVKTENLPQEVRERYIRAVKYYNDTIMDIEDKAEARGLEKGIEKGKLETVRAMIAERFDDETISKIAKLPKSKIEEIRKELTSGNNL